MNRIFNIDFKKVILYLLPKALRREKIFALIETFQAGVRSLYLLFLSMRHDHQKDLDITPQVFSLRKVLNDYFDSDKREIRIEDTVLFSPTYIFMPGEKKPIYLGKKAIYTNAELRNARGFVVIVPERLNTEAEEARMKAMINKYKLAGTKYHIRYEQD
jgi:hypothetical protein